MAYRRFRGRGQFTAGESRSGHGYNYAGRSVRLNEGPLQLTWNGPQVFAELFNALVNAFTQLSDEALDYMQSIVPVKSGTLRDSCFVNITVTNNRIRVVIGADTHYAVYVELGTSRMNAQPYIRPTYDFVLKQLPMIVRNEVGRRGR